MARTTEENRMKYSLIVVSYNAVDDLYALLKSIKESKIEDAEVVLVDNSPEPLFGDYKPPADCRIPFVSMYSGKNVGFAAACNEGAKAAKGDILIFVNPDCEVYDDWADRLCARLEMPGIVAVGPLASGFVSAYQPARLYGVETLGKPAYDECLEKFAGQTLTGVKVLIGFFLAIKKSVYMDIGMMDEGCFLGSDDLDLSLRLRDTYGPECLAVAKDVCVMHAGHKSFQSRPSKIVDGLIKDSEDYLREKLYVKYGGKPPSAHELWGVAFWDTERPRPMTLTVAMICRNETENLRVLLPQLWFADEIIIADTSVFGEVMEIPHFDGISEKIKVVKFPWVNDFAAARNFSCAQATKEWILWLDADDRVTEHAGKLIRAALDKPGWRTWNKNVAFEFIVTNSESSSEQFHQMRLYPNNPAVTWRNKVHENPLNSLCDLGITPIATDIPIFHTGYATLEIRQAKHDRNMAILEEEGDSPGKFFNMGNSWSSVHDWAKAEANYRAILEGTFPAPLDESFKDHIRYMVAMCLFQQRKMDEAGPYLNDNKKPCSVALLGEYHYNKGNMDEALIAFREYLRLTKEPYFDPWMSWRPMLRKKAASYLVKILPRLESELVEVINAECPEVLSG
jgi:GT2 family glycosyltransferase